MRRLEFSAGSLQNHIFMLWIRTYAAVVVDALGVI